MLAKLQKRNTGGGSGGFTIIEVMIVLAIAALILLIVLLAVPALQRNSRNTTVKNDASSVVGGINTFESDNNGASPTNVSGTGTVTIAGGGGSACTGTSNSETIKVNGGTATQCVTTAPSTATTSKLFVLPGKTCSGSSSARAFAVYYYIETSGGTSQQCLDS